MEALIDKFESIVILMTILDNQNLNYLTKTKLQEIADFAYELNIDLNCIDLEKDRNNYDIFDEWIEDTNTMYLDIKNQLSERCK